MPWAKASQSRRWWTLIGIVLFVISPCLPALKILDTQGNFIGYPGWPLLLFGWIEAIRILDGKLNGIGWFANPLFALGTLSIFLGAKRPGLLLLCAALLLSIMSLMLKEVPTDEGGNTAKVVGYEVGFWIWIASILVNLLVAMMVKQTPARTELPR